MTRARIGLVLSVAGVLGGAWGIAHLTSGETFAGLMWVLLGLSWSGSGYTLRKETATPHDGSRSKLGVALIVGGIALILVTALAVLLA